MKHRLRPIPSRWQALLLVVLSLTACKDDKPEAASTSQAARPVVHAGTEPATAPRTERWNVVFFLSDALRAANLSMYGYARSLTPTLDELAKESMVFGRHFSAASYTRLSVSQLFTGLLFAPPLMAGQFTDDVSREMSEEVLILPKAFREAGYYTSLVTAHPWFNKSAPVLQWYQNHTTVKSRHKYARFEELMPAVRETWTKARTNEQPFFLYLHSLDTHSPYETRRGFSDHAGESKALRRYDDYDAGIRYTDHWVGKVLEELDELQLSEHTLIVFTSDHGDEFNELGDGWSNEAHGSNLRRAATQVPLIIRLPPSHRVVGRFDDVSSHLDLASTLLSLAVPGIQLGKYHHDGVDLSKRVLMRELAPTRRAVFSHGSRYTAMRLGEERNLDFSYDEWTDRVTVFDHETNAGNYPVPKAVNQTGELEPYVAELTHVVRDPGKRFHQLPEKPAASASGTHRVNAVVVARTDVTPQYEDRVDGAWAIRSGRYASCRPNEMPGRLTVGIGNESVGRYRVKLVLHREGLSQGDLNGVTVTVFGRREERIVLAPKKRKHAESLDLGVHELPAQAEATLDEPTGGVVISGFELEFLDAPRQEPAPATAVEDTDPQLKQQLRALGYVE